MSEEPRYLIRAKISEGEVEDLRAEVRELTRQRDEARAGALEEAAKVAEKWVAAAQADKFVGIQRTPARQHEWMATRIAADIRALSALPPPAGSETGEGDAALLVRDARRRSAARRHPMEHGPTSRTVARRGRNARLRRICRRWALRMGDPITRPAPAPRMRIVPEVADTAMQHAGADAIDWQGKDKSPQKIFRLGWPAMLDAAPNAGCVSREMVDAMTEAACASHFGISWADFATGHRRMSLRNMRAALLAAFTVAGLTVAPAADTAREQSD